MIDLRVPRGEGLGAQSPNNEDLTVHANVEAQSAIFLQILVHKNCQVGLLDAQDG